jgi:hypothetical protein
MHRIAAIIVAVVTIACARESLAQTTITSSTRDTSQVGADTGTFHMAKSPLEAVLLSAAFPGAGQVYLGQAWKLPILYGLIGGFAYGVIIQNVRYHTSMDSINAENAKMTNADSNRANEFVSPREFYRNDRDKWWIYLGITYIAQVLDAYIASNLYDFDVSDPAPSGFQSYYDPINRQVGMSFTLRF